MRGQRWENRTPNNDNHNGNRCKIMRENMEGKRAPGNFTCESHKNDSKTLGEERGLKGAVSALVGRGEGFVLVRRCYWLIAWFRGFCLFWFGLVSDTCWENIPHCDCGVLPA